MTHMLTEKAESPTGRWLRRVIEDMRVLIVGGIPVGVLVVGVCSHAAMSLLRVTSPDRVRGVTSDDGFTIGQVTLAGSYNLMLLGAAFGVLGAGAYRLVAPWLITRRPMRVDVETGDGLTRGRTVGDEQRISGRPINAEVSVDLDREPFLDLVVDAVARFP